MTGVIDADRKSWVAVPDNSHFPIQNLPFGIFRPSPGQPSRVGTAIGDFVLDLDAVWNAGFFDDLKIPAGIFQNTYLNDFMALGKATTTTVRIRIADLLDADGLHLNDRSKIEEYLWNRSEINMLLPVKVGDYTDFYSSKEHATNVGSMFRDPDNALLPNWLHLPVGYHGRASSIVVSGTPIRRPMGQQIPSDSSQPVFGPSKLLDFELEMAFVIGRPTSLGARISTGEAEDYIFGLVLFNDWSARDIQKWEYVPLGPFLGKSFGSTISPWVVPLEALEYFRVDGPAQEPEVLPYLKCNGPKNFDIRLEVRVAPENGESTRVCASNFKYMYWNMNQQLTHHTVNGCNLNVGDMMASGTISGPTPDSYGSMLEISWRGTKPVKMADGTERKFLLDGDTVIMSGYAEKDGLRVGFGEAVGKILPAK